MMEVEQLIFSLRLPGCHSLKEKRRALAGIREHFGRLASVAVCESAYADSHQRSEWTFVMIGQDQKQIAQMRNRIEAYLAESVDAEILRVERVRL